MMTKFSFLLIILFVLEVRAQQVVPLFRNDSHVTQVAIPFSLSDVSYNPQEITELEVTGDAGHCKGMIDPFIRSNFFIKCSEPDTAHAIVHFTQNGKTVKLNYGPVPVIAISTKPVVIPTPNPTPPGPDYSEGRLLYTSKNCIICHGEALNLRNRTAAQISTAIRVRPQMQGIQLTETELRALSLYLSNL